MINHEFGKATPDQVTTERLNEALLQICEVQNLDPETIDPLSLAVSMQGLSRAVSDVVLSKGCVETTDLTLASTYDASIMPAVYASNIMRVFEDPSERTGLMFTAQPEKKYNGACIGLHMVTPGDQQTVCDIALPDDHTIDKLLSQDPILWLDQSAKSRNCTHDRPVISYPFNSLYGESDSASTYLKTLQVLSAELVRLCHE